MTRKRRQREGKGLVVTIAKRHIHVDSNSRTQTHIGASPRLDFFFPFTLKRRKIKESPFDNATSLDRRVRNGPESLRSFHTFTRNFTLSHPHIHALLSSLVLSWRL